MRFEEQGAAGLTGDDTLIATDAQVFDRSMAQRPWCNRATAGRLTMLVLIRRRGQTGRRDPHDPES